MLFMNRCLHFHIRSPHSNPSLLLRKQYLSLREQCLSQRERGLNAVGLRAFLDNPTYALLVILFLQRFQRLRDRLQAPIFVIVSFVDKFRDLFFFTIRKRETIFS